MIPDNQNDQYAKESSRILLYTATAWDVLRNAVKDYQHNGDVNMAAAIAFYFILSIIPFFMLTILVAGLIFGANPDIPDELIRTIQTFHPYFSEEILVHFGRIEQKMQLLGWLGIILLVWFSSLVFNSVQTSLEIILRSPKKRKYVMSKFMAIAMIALGWAVIITTMGITYLATMIGKNSSVAQKSWVTYSLSHNIFFHYLLSYLIMVIFFAFVYKMIPKAEISWRNAFSASVLFSTLTEIGKHLFTWYISNYSRYHIIFGSLETLMVFVVWVFYVAAIFLFCAELISSYQKRDLILLEKTFLMSGDNK